jgi:hypothetical protein
MWFAWLSVALAGTIRVHSATPVSVKIDGQIVGRLVTEVTVTDVQAGTHSVQVVDALGALLASTDVIVPEHGDPMWFDYYAHRLLPVDRQLAPADAKPIPDAAMQSLEVHLAKKRTDAKKLKYLTKYYAYYWYEMRHVDSLLTAFGSTDIRIQACQMLAPRTLDPQNAHAIEDQFPLGEFRDRAMASFAGFVRDDEDDWQ